MPMAHSAATELEQLLGSGIAGEPISELVRQGLQALIEAESATALGADRRKALEILDGVIFPGSFRGLRDPLPLILFCYLTSVMKLFLWTTPPAREPLGPRACSLGWFGALVPAWLLPIWANESAKAQLRQICFDFARLGSSF